MIYSETPLKSFCEQYGIAMRKEEEACTNCGEKFPEPRPFLIKGYAGIQYKCPCGGKFSSQCTFVPRTEEQKKFWREILGD